MWVCASVSGVHVTDQTNLEEVLWVLDFAAAELAALPCDGLLDVQQTTERTTPQPHATQARESAHPSINGVELLTDLSSFLSGFRDVPAADLPPLCSFSANAYTHVTM